MRRTPVTVLVGCVYSGTILPALLTIARTTTAPLRRVEPIDNQRAGGLYRKRFGFRRRRTSGNQIYQSNERDQNSIFVIRIFS